MYQLEPIRDIQQIQIGPSSTETLIESGRRQLDADRLESCPAQQSIHSNVSPRCDKWINGDFSPASLGCIHHRMAAE